VTSVEGVRKEVDDDEEDPATVGEDEVADGVVDVHRVRDLRALCREEGDEARQIGVHEVSYVAAKPRSGCRGWPRSSLFRLIAFFRIVLSSRSAARAALSEKLVRSRSSANTWGCVSRLLRSVWSDVMGVPKSCETAATSASREWSERASEHPVFKSAAQYVVCVTLESVIGRDSRCEHDSRRCSEACVSSVLVRGQPHLALRSSLHFLVAPFHQRCGMMDAIDDQGW
jgi:hypothetical protein